jgi:hypothetical protein
LALARSKYQRLAKTQSDLSPRTACICQVQRILKFHHFFADVFVLHQSGNIEVMLNGVAFIFTFDAEMITGHVHLCWSGIGFYAVKRNENRPDLECLDG